MSRATFERRSSREEAVDSETCQPSTSRPGRVTMRQQSVLPCATRLPDPRAAALSQPIDSGEPSKPMGAASEDESRSCSDDSFSFSSFSQRFAAMNSRLNGATESGSSRAEEDESRSYSDDNFSFSQRFAAMNSRLNGVTESGSSRAEADESRLHSNDSFSFSQRFAAMSAKLNGATESGSSRAESFSSGDCPRAAIAAQSGGTKSFSIPRGDTQSSSSPRRPPSVESVSSAAIMTAEPDRTRAAVHI